MTGFPSQTDRAVPRLTDGHDADADETTPLLLTQTGSQSKTAVESIAVPVDSETKPVTDDDVGKVKKWPRSVRWLVLLCALMTSLSFGVTQAP